MREAAGTSRLLGQWLRKLLARDAVSPDFVARADSLRLLGDLEQAEALCARGLAEYPQYASAHAVMGDIHRDKGALEAAEAAWREACRLHPDHPRANLCLAQLYLSRGDLPQAMAALGRAMVGNPHSPEVARLSHRLHGGAPVDQPEKTAAPPAWLSPARFSELLSSARACASVVEARLVGPGGTLVAGTPLAGADTETAAHLAATLMEESRPLMERLGIGHLRAAFLRGERRRLGLFEVSGHYLLSELMPEAQPGNVRSELQPVIAALRRSTDDGVRPDASQIAA